MKSKKAFEMSFAWIFSIIVGGIILALAIYAASQFISTGQYKVNTVTAKEFTNLFDPLQTSVESGKINGDTRLITDTRVYTYCLSEGVFGENLIMLAEKSGFNKKWSEPGGDITIKNQYIFAESILETKNPKFFIKPFYMPFKIADIMMMYSEDYCFVNAPEKIAEELNNFISVSNGTGLYVKDSIAKCEGKKTVCFSGSCDINVNCNNGECSTGYVKKDGKQLYFYDSLIYGAIFSSPENYECNVERLMKKTEYLAQIYAKKAQFVSIRDCNSGLATDMSELANQAHSFSSGENIFNIAIKAQDINIKNEVVECQLY
ncbi:MAG: hypothetical protein WC781_04245 [Candidatus Pacearchaeota archaeon]|jgi:hypothetical protein